MFELRLTCRGRGWGPNIRVLEPCHSPPANVAFIASPSSSFTHATTSLSVRGDLRTLRSLPSHNHEPTRTPSALGLGSKGYLRMHRSSSMYRAWHCCMAAATLHIMREAPKISMIAIARLPSSWNQWLAKPGVVSF